MNVAIKRNMQTILSYTGTKLTANEQSIEFTTANIKFYNFSSR